SSHPPPVKRNGRSARPMAEKIISKKRKIGTMGPTPGEISRLLEAWGNGEPAALDQLVPLVYGELHRMAARYMNRENQGISLQPTALVHEAYLRLMGAADVRWQNRAHFFAVSAQTMRRILVDAARARGADKRGGGMGKVDFNQSID